MTDHNTQKSLALSIATLVISLIGADLPPSFWPSTINLTVEVGAQWHYMPVPGTFEGGHL